MLIQWFVNLIISCKLIPILQLHHAREEAHFWEGMKSNFLGAVEILEKYCRNDQK